MWITTSFTYSLIRPVLGSLCNLICTYANRVETAQSPLTKPCP
jgi:hypothetical protein